MSFFDLRYRPGVQKLLENAIPRCQVQLHCIALHLRVLVSHTQRRGIEQKVTHVEDPAPKKRWKTHSQDLDILSKTLAAVCAESLAVPDTAG